MSTANSKDQAWQNLSRPNGPKRHDTWGELSTVYPIPIIESHKSSHSDPSIHPGHMQISSLQADLFSVSSCLQNLRWEMAFGLTPLVTLDLLSCNLLLGTVNAVNANRDVWPTWPLSLRVLREMALWQVQADGVSFLAHILPWTFWTMGGMGSQRIYCQLLALQTCPSS